MAQRVQGDRLGVLDSRFWVDRPDSLAQADESIDFPFFFPCFVRCLSVPRCFALSLPLRP